MGDLRNELREFISEYIHSVVRLEVLLLFSGDAERVWSADAVNRKLNLYPPSASAHLDELSSQGLLKIVDGDYRFDPASDELRNVVQELSDAYATQRVAVLTMLFANPAEKVRLFTESFRMINGESESKGAD